MSLALSWRRLAHESQGQVPEGTQPEQGRHKKLVGRGRFFSWLPDLTLHYVQYNPLNPAMRPSVEVTIGWIQQLGEDIFSLAKCSRPDTDTHTHAHTHTHTLGVSLTDEHKRCACIGPAGRDPFFKPSAIAMNSNVSQQSCRCLPARLFCPCIQFR